MLHKYSNIFFVCFCFVFALVDLIWYCAPQILSFQTGNSDFDFVVVFSFQTSTNASALPVIRMQDAQMLLALMSVNVTKDTLEMERIAKVC